MILSVTRGEGGGGGGESQICFVAVGGGLEVNVSDCYKGGRRSLEKHQIELYVTV